MKEVSVEIAYSEEVLSILNEYMDDLIKEIEKTINY